MGLWDEQFNNQTASGLPSHEGLWTRFPLSGHPNYVNTNNGWSLALSGRISSSHSDKFYFRVTAKESSSGDAVPTTLSVGNTVLFDCFNSGSPGGVVNCGNSTTTDNWVMLWGQNQNFSLQVASPQGHDIDLVIQWSRNVPGNWLDVPIGRFDPNRTLMTSQRTASADSGGYEPTLVENWTYPTDQHLATGKPQAVTSTDQSTNTNDSSAQQSRTTTYAYDDSSGRIIHKVLPDPGSGPRPEHWFTYGANGDQGCMTQKKLDTYPNASGPAYVVDQLCDASGDVTSKTRHIEAVANQSAYTLSTSATYDLFGNVLTSTAPDGVKTSNSYDAAGFLTSTKTEVRALSSSTTSVYDQTDYAYDTAG
jgi:YD repeat-containing protein